MSKLFVFIFVGILLSSCTIKNGENRSIPLESKLTFEMSNLDKELVVRVYELSYINVHSFFLVVRPYLPREATLHFFSDKNLLVYADQKHRVGKFEEIVHFVDNVSFHESGFDNNKIDEFGRLIYELRLIPFYLSDMGSEYEDKTTSYFKYYRDHNDPGNYDNVLGQHFVKWFSSCLNMKITGKVEFDKKGLLDNEWVKIYIARSICVDKMTKFIEHTKKHKNLNKHENTKDLNIKGDVLDHFKEVHPLLFKWKTPSAVSR